MEKSQDILVHFKSLSAVAQAAILQSLRAEFEGKGKLLEVVQSENKIKKACPHCGAARVHKRGKQNDVQMYKCSECTKWFSSTTGTPLWDIKRKDKWQSYLNCMQQGMSIKKTAKEIGICIQTSFDWRIPSVKYILEYRFDFFILLAGVSNYLGARYTVGIFLCQEFC